MNKEKTYEKNSINQIDELIASIAGFIKRSHLSTFISDEFYLICRKLIDLRDKIEREEK